METNKLIQTIQKDLIKFLRWFDKYLSLSKITKDNCSEISRYIWVEITEKYWANTNPFILKWHIIINDKKVIHDILGFYYENIIHIIDPTIRQFFPRKRSIYVLSSKESFEETIDLLNNKYWWDWKVSERLYIKMKAEKQERFEMVKMNIVDVNG